ncbi:sodium-independent sulfate anion transporter-like [Hermetia illucens]|uniref:sodium-independent sulfate anion transporter-like n=1 Tax=Hermetia illucens TaxID=343691 RepID=UPI0018CC522E|nr:sodium-independent sulfate anion transporter-like [Hermetia illucens]
MNTNYPSTNSQFSSQSDDLNGNLDRYYKEELPDVLGAVRRKARNGCGKKLLFERLPILKWMPEYRLSYLPQDFLAGLTVGLTAIPQGIAYAVVGGLRPQYGLYSDFMGSFVYILFGTCKDITIGPTAIMALMVQKHTEYSPDFAVLMTFLAGCIILLLGLLNLGFLVQFISAPVIAGFTSAAALTIGSAQVNNLFGLASKSNEFIDAWENFFTNLGSIRLWDSLLGVLTLVFLLVLRKFKDLKGRWANFGKYLSLSRNALAVIIGTLLAYILRDSQPFRLTGQMDPGLPPFQPPPFSTTVDGSPIDFIGMVTRLSTTIIALPIVSILESVAITKAFSKGKIVAASQEMVALGMCNLFGSFVSSMPITASFTRTAINNASGARTTLGGIVTGVLVLLTLGFLTDAFYYIPKATLAAIIISAMIFLFHYEKPIEIWKAKKIDLLPYLITVLISVFLGLEIGIGCGIVLNLAFILYETARPKVHFIEEKVSGCEVVIVKPTQGIPFSAAENLKYRIVKYVTNMGSDQKYVVIDGELIRSIDTTTAWNIVSMCEDLRLLKAEIIFWNWEKNTAGVIYRLSHSIGNHLKSGTNILEYIRKDIQNKVATTDTESLP